MTKKDIIYSITELLEQKMLDQTSLLIQISFLLKSKFDNSQTINNAISQIGTYCFPFTEILTVIQKNVNNYTVCTNNNKKLMVANLKPFYSNIILKQIMQRDCDPVPDFSMLLGLTVSKKYLGRLTIKRLGNLKKSVEHIVTQIN